VFKKYTHFNKECLLAYLVESEFGVPLSSVTCTQQMVLVAVTIILCLTHD